jgi:MFS family permease
MYIVSRMLLGVGILFAIISGSALIGELAYPKERATMTSLFNASYFIGSIMAAAIAIRTTNILGFHPCCKSALPSCRSARSCRLTLIKLSKVQSNGL